MSNTLTPSGLQSSAGLYGSCGVYQFDRNGAIFNPLDLNPYLLFDAESSMIGTLENPTLDLDPTKQETLDVITATRAGTATFVNLDGEIEIAQPNTVRVDSSLGYPAILVEPSSENLVTATQEVASWSATNVSVTSNTTTAPDGSQTGDTVTRTAGGADVRQTKAVTSGTSYTISIFAKAETDNEISLDLSDSRMGPDKVEFNTRTGQKVSGSANYSITELSNGWRRYSFTSTCISSGNTGVIVRIENDEPVQLWGFQFEEGSVPTSYIPTSGGDAAARTRNADQLSLSTSVTSSFFSSTDGGTFYAEFVPRNLVNEQWYLLSGQDTSRRFMYSNANNAQLRAFDGTTVRTFGSDMVENQLNRAAFTYTTTTQEASINGSTVAAFSHNGNYLTTSRLYLSSPVNDKQMNGHIKRLLFWPVSSERL